MQTVADIYEEIFGQVAVKRLTANQKRKTSFEVDQQMRKIFETAGVKFAAFGPKEDRPTIAVRAIEPHDERFVTASYYAAQRAGTGRTPEPRLGQELVSGWLEVGDRMVIATDGSTLFASRSADRALSADEAIELRRRLASRASLSYVETRAPEAPRRPKRLKSQREEFERSPFVVEQVLRRANGRCEQPECVSDPIVRSDGSIFLEVHHIVWLRNGGYDHRTNAAALCPRCHRSHHHAGNRNDLTAALAAAVAAKESAAR